MKLNSQWSCHNEDMLYPRNKFIVNNKELTLGFLLCHKMIPDFIDSMWCLSQFNSAIIIIPQTPFPKGGLGSPHSRDCGV
jgi:hypothetical protein